MEQNTNQAEPTDDLDRAIEEARQAMNKGRQTVQDATDDGDDDDDEEAPKSKAVPEEDDDDDEEDTSDEDVDTEAESKDESDEDEEDLQDSDEDEQPKPKKRAQDSEEQPKKKKREGLSRKQYGSLVDRLKADLQKTEEEKKKLADQTESRAKRDADLQEALKKALGTEEEYQKLMNLGLSGDKDAGRKARILQNNRAFFGKLQEAAESLASDNLRGRFNEILWTTATKMPGIDKAIVEGKPLDEVLRHLYATGYTRAETKLNKEITELKDKNATLRAKLKKAATDVGGSSRELLSGGTPVATKQKKNKLVQELSADGGFPSEELIAAVRGGKVKLSQLSSR